jgi:hypothetical protein
MSDQPKDSEFGKVFRERLEQELASKLTTPKIATRNAIAMGLMAIVDRQIGKGESDTEEAWARLLEVVQANPAAQHMVTELKAALTQYETDIQKQIEAGGDEAEVRKTASAIIKMAIMVKVQPPKPAADATPAAEAAPAAEAEAEAEAEKVAPGEPKAGN